jgi:UDP-N-acetylmuramate dehydrogenase
MHAAAEIYRCAVTNAPTADEVELVGDEELGSDELGAIANPRSLLAPAQRAALRELAGAAVRLDEPMRRHTTLKIGGPADAFVEPASVHDTAALARWCAAERLPITVVGGGSNLLVRDGGVRGVVLGTGRLRGLELVPPSTIRVEAGVATGKVLSLALKNDLGGIEFLGGVPGSVGGGMIMNAGTYLGEFKDVTTWVETVRLCDGEVIRRDNAACGFRYRDSDLPPSEVVVAAELALRPRPRAEIEAEVRGLRKRRAEREPKKVSSNGSTFKNPPGDFAGRLIEVAGCKGWREGDAVCSPVHANWLVNTGRATAAQLIALIARVRAEVVRVHSVTLELEVKIIGEDER